MNQTSWTVGLLAAVMANLAAMLAGCGGGGDDPAPVPAVTYDVQKAFKNLPTVARSYNLTGVATNGGALTLAWTIAPVGASVFPLTNTASVRVDSSVVVRTAALQELVNGSQQSHFNAAGAGLGSVRPDGSCSQGDNPALPAAAVLGATGDLGAATVYGTCVLSAPVVNRITGNWTLEQGTGLVYLCANTVLTDVAGATVSRESDCIEVSPDGTVGSHARVKLNVLGTELIFSN